MLVRKYKWFVVKVVHIVLLIIVLFNIGIRFTQYGRNKSGRKHLTQKRIELREINKDITTRKLFAVNANSVVNTRKISREQQKDVGARSGKKTKTNKYEPLEYIPSVLESVNTDKIPYIADSITNQFLVLPNITYKYMVAILTPIRNAESALDRFVRQVGRLTYPKELMSLFFGEDGSTDNTFEKAYETIHQLKMQNKLKSAYIVRLNISGGLHGNVLVRHKKDVQQSRRAHMALARNRLLQYALRQHKFDHILWIDSDIAELPVDLVQQMLFAKSDVVATCCLIKSNGYKVKYDRNSWRETEASLKLQSLLESDKLVLEGYNKTLRVSLPDLKSEGRVVPLDGVGGCALMVKAECHRSGLQFPEVVYKHHIETEGLAKMAKDMGYKVVGLPFVEVFHG